jgi:N-acetylglucosaminyldiphosphoundecaprenol N-acetyl-beta-D-mannosaminyltransferase
MTDRIVNSSCNIPTRTDVLQVGVSAVNLDTAAREIKRWIDGRLKQYVCVTSVHGIIESQSDPVLRTIHNSAGLVTPDGMPLVWLSRLSGKSGVSRVYGPDLMLELCSRGETHKWRHFFYGATQDTLDCLTKRLQAKYPAIQVVGTIAPPFRSLTEMEAANVTSEINAASPDIVWVGLSTPKQERWMDAFRERLNAPVLIGVGAAFDMHAGKLSQAPRWIQRSGFEWMYRLCMEPRRLWKRYLKNNPLFVALLIGQAMGLREASTLVPAAELKLATNGRAD